MGAVVLKEMDGARSIELEVKNGAVYLETGDHCFKFDMGIALRAIERLYDARVLVRGDGSYV